MLKSEVAKLLAYISGADRRDLNELSVEVWHDLLGGVTFDAALAHLRDRMPSEACSLIVAALRVASHTGGNIAETLEGIARTLRERFQLQGKLQALTAQGRLQAWIVGALPLLLLAALSYLDPEMMVTLWHTPIGWGVLSVVGVLEISGTLLIRRIVNIDL